jgi:predicted nucleic acid-binding protein
MKHYLLDTSALLTLRDNVPGADQKATQNLSLADAWIAACALLQGAILVHKDPELMTVACEQIVLPLKR